MKKKRTVFIYFILSVMLIGSAAALAYQVRHFKYERDTNPTREFEDKLIDPDVTKNAIAQKENEERRKTTVVFAQTKSFQALATPHPRPSPTPRPLPSPTPVTPGKKWKVDLVTQQMAILQKYTGDYFTVKKGDKMTDEVYGNFTILELIPDLHLPRVKIKHDETGTVAEITQQAVTTAPAPAKKKR